MGSLGGKMQQTMWPWATTYGESRQISPNKQFHKIQCKQLLGRTWEHTGQATTPSQIGAQIAIHTYTGSSTHGWSMWTTRTWFWPSSWPSPSPSSWSMSWLCTRRRRKRETRKGNTPSAANITATNAYEFSLKLEGVAKKEKQSQETLDEDWKLEKEDNSTFFTEHYSPSTWWEKHTSDHNNATMTGELSE